MFFRKSDRWETSVKKLRDGEISVQEFVNANEKKKLYYSTPFFENDSGQHTNVLQTHDSDTVYFPVFTDVAGLREHMAAIGGKRYIIIEGNLKDVLDSLDSHPLLRTWGVVIDPMSRNSIGLPPKVRVRPKCLR